jgi:hypothetical protein
MRKAKCLKCGKAIEWPRKFYCPEHAEEARKESLARYQSKYYFKVTKIKRREKRRNQI